MHPLLTEIRYHPKFLRLTHDNPVAATEFIQGMERDLNWQWPAFLEYKQGIKEGQYGGMEIGGAKESGVMPECYTRWIKFLNPEEVPSKLYLKEFMSKHKELWLHERVYLKEVSY